MGLNFEYITKGKCGDIIYPAYNGTNGFWSKSRWDLVIAIDKKGNIIGRRFIWDIATVKSLELMREFKDIILSQKSTTPKKAGHNIRKKKGSQEDKRLR